MVPFLVLCGNQEWIFLRYLLWEPGWAPRGKTQKRGTPTLHPRPPQWLSLQQFVSYSPRFPTGALAPVEVSVLISCIHLFLQFRGQKFALRPHFSDRAKKSYWISSVCLACYLLLGLATSKLLTCWTRNQKSGFFTNKVLLEHSHTHSFPCRLWLLECSSCGVEWSPQTGPWSWEDLLCGHLQRNCAHPFSRW